MERVLLVEASAQVAFNLKRRKNLLKKREGPSSMQKSTSTCRCRLCLVLALLVSILVAGDSDSDGVHCPPDTVELQVEL